MEICGRLDGIPLAIELAASRMQSMTVTELRDRLDDRFRLLVGSRRGLERHQTLRHAVGWSYDLLDDTEKTLLARCSVFAGGFDLAAACAVRWLRRRLGHTGCARCAGAQVPAGRRPIIGADPVFDAGDDPPVRRGATRGQWCGRRGPRRACPPLRRAGNRHHGPVGQPPTTGGVRLVRHRVGQSAHGVSVGRRPRRPGCRRANRNLCGIGRLSDSRITNRSRGPKSLSSQHAPSTTPGWRSCMWWRQFCYMAGRIEAAVGYSDAGQEVIGSGRAEVPFGAEGLLGGCVRCCRPAGTVDSVVSRSARARSGHPRVHHGVPGHRY